ncbi:MAG: glycosyltransferase family 9 protein [Desulfobaccales bacterium]
MEIVVINLMRLGDLIQCTPVLRGLRTGYPDSRVSLVVQDLFRDTAALLPNVDRLLPFPSSILATLLDQEQGWPEAVKCLNAWLQESFPRPPELVINLTPTQVGGILAYLTQAREMRGIMTNSRRTLVTRPSWASYALVVSKVRQTNPFNLVDLFLRESGLIPDGQGAAAAVPAAADKEAEGFFRQLELPPATSLIGLLPGASQPERCWPPEFFAQAGQRLLETRACHFLIFGSTKERPLGEAIARQMPPGTVALFLGRTSPALLAAYLKRLDLLITNDTGPMHLAAAVGTPTLALFLASARVQDTGPVGQGHVVLEPDMDCHPCLTPCPSRRCQKTISPQAVAWWAARRLDPTPLTLSEEKNSWPGLRISLAGTNPEGYQTYLPLVRRPLGRREFWLWVHRLTWGQVLDSSTFLAASAQAWVEKILLRHYLPPREELGIQAGEGFLLELGHAAAHGERITHRIMTLADCAQEFPGRLWQQIEVLKGVDQNLRRLGAAFPELRALVEFFFQEQRDNEASEILPLAGRLQQSYVLLKRLGEAALESVARLKKVLGLSAAGGDFSELAQSMQNEVTGGQTLLPEREELSCR